MKSKKCITCKYWNQVGLVYFKKKGKLHGKYIHNCKRCYELMFHVSSRDFARMKVRIRDKFKCQKCKKKWKKGTRHFDVHHLDSHLEGKTGRTYCNNPIDRLITLCHKCHMNLHVVKEKRENGMKKVINR